MSMNTAEDEKEKKQLKSDIKLDAFLKKAKDYHFSDGNSEEDEKEDEEEDEEVGSNKYDKFFESEEEKQDEEGKYEVVGGVLKNEDVEEEDSSDSPRRPQGNDYQWPRMMDPKLVKMFIEGFTVEEIININQGKNR